jgi:murein DD-endopeptidase MepM/ murein hydrolase activator NlpD
MSHILNITLLTCTIFFLGCRTPIKSQRPEQTITVQQGDTLASIATKYNTTWFDILRDNNMRDDRQIYVGQKIRVRPGPGGYVASEMEVKNESNANPASPPRRGLLFGPSSQSSIPEKLPWPVIGSVSSDFGWRWGRMHAGIDIRAKRGTPIKSPARGRVTFAARNGGYGNLIILDHGGYKTAYAHCNSIKVRHGSYVDEGQIIGSVGSTGNSSGSHLHFEYRTPKNGAIDPMPFLQARKMMSAIVPDQFKFQAHL